MIRVYPSMLPGEPIETHAVDGVSLAAWLADNVPDFDISAEHHPIIVKRGGRIAQPYEWPELIVTPDATVDIYIAPKSGAVDAISSVISSVVGIFTSVFSFLMPSVPGGGGRNQSQQGSELKGVNAQANQPRLNAVIPDQAGRYKKYPDLLCQPVKRFVNQRSQVLRLFMSLGRGSYSRDVDDLKIGSTPLSSIDGASYQFFEPGATVSGNSASQNWYNAPEVGSSTGSAGLRLRGVSTAGASFDGEGSSSGDIISINSSYLPESWSGDIRLIVRLTQEFTIDTNQTSFFGDFRHMSAGVAVTIQGTPFAGTYRTRSASATGMLIEDFDTGVLVDDLPPGSYSGFVDRTNATYGVVERFDGTQQVRLQRYTVSDDVDTTWSSFPTLSGVVMNIDPSATIPAGLWTGPFLACPVGEETNTIEWDIFCPNGLGFIGDDGGIEQRTRGIELEWREIGTSTWNAITDDITGGTRDQLGFTFSANLGGAVTPEVRIRRLDGEDTSTQALDKIEWYGLRSRLSAPTSYPGISTLAVTITGSDLIASQTENQINIVETRKLNGTASRSIADYARYVMDDVGLTTNDIDEDEFDRLATLWDSRGDYYDYVHNEPSTVNATLDQILRAGHAEKTITDARITPVRDEARSTLEQMYTLQNMTGEGLKRTVTPIRDDDVDGVDVEFINGEENTWVRETVECRLPGDAGFRPEKVRLDGVISRRNAFRIGMKMRSAQRFRRKAFEFSTEMDALNSEYWSYCALSDDVPGYTSSGLVLQATGSGSVTIKTSEPLDWQDGETHLIAWREPDGLLNGPYTATRGADDYTVLYNGDAPTVDYSQELPHYMFGVSQRFSYPVLISSIEPQGFSSVNVQAVNYDERVYDYDNSEPPA